MKLRVALSAILAGGLLTGCGEFKSLWADRYGPNPVLGDTLISDPLQREGQVVNSFLLANGYAGTDRLMPPNRKVWLDVILTGFNTVDDACQTYINDLWKFDRQKNRLKDVITASGAATAAIIGANANPSTATLTTLAQTFGLASTLTGAIGDSYLFAQDPATIGKIVKKLQVAYRNDLAKNYLVATYPIDSYAAVYYHTREYLSLCLPPTIQGQIQDLLAKANATPELPNGTVTVKRATAGALPAKATTAVTLGTPGG